MKRLSKKQKTILALLRSTTEHPSTGWVYEKMREVYPSIRFAAVCRGLAALKAAGEIRSVGFVNGKERFDAATHPHVQVICRLCGRVVDLPPVPVPDEITASVALSTGFTIGEASYVMYGMCRKCKQMDVK